MKQKCTWMGKIFTATCSFIIWAFQTQPKRPRALTSSSWRGFRPTSGEGGDGPGSWKHSRKTPVNHQMMPFKSTTRWSRRTTHCWDAETERVVRFLWDRLTSLMSTCPYGGLRCRYIQKASSSTIESIVMGSREQTSMFRSSGAGGGGSITDRQTTTSF